MQGILFESVHQRADGTVFPVEASSQGADIGGTRTLVAIIRDITQRKQVEEALRSSQEQTQAIIDGATETVVYLKDAEGRFITVNSRFEKLLGITRDEVRGKTDYDILTRDQADDYRAHDQLILSTGRSMQIEEVALLADGKEHTLLVNKFPLVDAAGRPFAVCAISADITERKQVEEALLRSEKLASVGRMAATISHEINNPLEAVTNLLFLLKGMADLPESAREYVETADAEVKRIAHITRQSLGFYRELSAPSPTSVDEVLESAINLLKNKIAAKQAVIRRQWNKRAEITAIAGELRQVFTNLLANSLDAIGEKGIITLRVSACLHPNNGNRCVRVTIADDGIGATAQPHVFEPFFTTKDALGTGLGLWVSKQIVDKHGGTIRLRSSTDEEHRGTVFSILFPVKPATPRQSAGAD